MLNFFLSSDVTLSDKLLEIVYILMGIISVYAGVKNLFDKKNKHPI